MRGSFWSYTNTDSEEIRPPWSVSDVADDNKKLNIALCADYARIWAEDTDKLGSASTLSQVQLIVTHDNIGALAEFLAVPRAGEDFFLQCEYDDGDSAGLVGMVLAFNPEGLLEVVAAKRRNEVRLTLSAESVDDFSRLLRAQAEALELVEAEKVRVTKTYAEWERIVEALKADSKSWYAEEIAGQVRYRGYLADDDVTVVFGDGFMAEKVLEITMVELSATVEQWQRIAEALRNDQRQILAEVIEEGLDEYLFGASPVQRVELTFDWNDAPEVEDVMWRLSVFGEDSDVDALEPVDVLRLVKEKGVRIA